jgi:hypothetical protein
LIGNAPALKSLPMPGNDVGKPAPVNPAKSAPDKLGIPAPPTGEGGTPMPVVGIGVPAGPSGTEAPSAGCAADQAGSAEPAMIGSAPEFAASGTPLARPAANGGTPDGAVIGWAKNAGAFGTGPVAAVSGRVYGSGFVGIARRP